MTAGTRQGDLLSPNICMAYLDTVMVGISVLGNKISKVSIMQSTDAIDMRDDDVAELQETYKHADDRSEASRTQQDQPEEDTVDGV